MRSFVTASIIAVACALGCGTTLRVTDASTDDGRAVDRVDVGSVVDQPTIDEDASVETDAPLESDSPGFDAPVEVDTPDGDAPTRTDAASDRVDAPGDDRVDVVTELLNPSCEAAAELTEGETLRLQSVVRRSETLRNCDGSPSDHAYELWYRVVVPANTILEVDVGNEGSVPPVLAMRAFADCGASSCLADAAPGYPVAPLMFHNREATARTVRVVLSRGLLPSHGGFSFRVTARFHAAAPNRTCATALPLAGGVTLRDQDLGATTERTGLCAGAPPSP